ncbi:DNA-binding protein RHL1 [Cucurbita argyrosperma subsp. argyrosperma]|nr:DNA-binding protein RHL1 [Cucurbita argyrosperma subsp. argyrosperma]
MARGSSSSKTNKANAELEPEIAARKRLKKLAFSNNLLSGTQAKPQGCLCPSATVLKHNGKDIVKKSHRKNRFLFSFSGLLAPVSGGKIGELKDLGSKNPILYLEFPQGRMKLFGTIMYPKNRYLTLQFSRGGKNVTCEDYFDNMIVFSDAWWIGTKDENQEEARLDFPKELSMVQCGEYDFNGGAGVVTTIKPSAQKKGINRVEDNSLKGEHGDDLVDLEDNMTTPIKTTPVRHSERSAGKVFKYYPLHILLLFVVFAVLEGFVSAQKVQLSGSKRKIDQLLFEFAGGKVTRKDTEYEVEDDIEELSSSQEDTDEDWTS